MARYLGPSCRLCRAAGDKLFLKGDRCYTSKCAIERRKVKPGGHAPSKLSEYGVQLKEKQKIKRIYGLLEAQFYIYFKKANAKAGITGENLMQFLERRLDNVVYRLGLGKSRAQSRQIVGHGHINVNGSKVDIASYLVNKDDVITFNEDLKMVSENRKDVKLPVWLKLDNNSFIVDALPARDAVDADVREQMVVEFYSR
jgi:small subunit ribosomal protein S4